MSSVALSSSEETYLGIFVIAFCWALFSGACVVASVQARQHTSSWARASSLLASSLVAAYCFGRLL
jgi:hypothetical protein